MMTDQFDPFRVGFSVDDDGDGGDEALEHFEGRFQ